VEAGFARVFHDELRGLTPSLRATTGYAQLSAELARCVLWAALTQDSVEVVERTVRGFAAGHHSRGYPDDAYRNLGHALIRSVRTILPMGWSSQLSSGWVSYALWLQPHLAAGSFSAVASATGETEPLAMDVILVALRNRYFPGQDKALNAVCTRVMLRTGVDLREPRPEQRTDPVLIGEVLESLLLMGYAPVAGVSGVASRSAASPAAAATVAGRAGVKVDTPDARRQRQWWRLRRHGR
jgi:hypothetical protein